MNRLVHLELHTHDLGGASAFYDELLQWRTERIDVPRGPYHALAIGGPLDGGVVECGTAHPTWLPYVEVEEIEVITERARRLGASVLRRPREGPAGWSSVLRSSVGGEIALWQPKQPLVKGMG
ncbi:VOC family protein [Pseudonocardia sp. TRM90224]|uniref:VOC family protein n=1 Tax=Pseudonocardia sp. TRM90224 TaxID=2812678 RepID=UPI001E4E519F|nr:VOC family protein [Pseudonocardia sp. TRM90224]